MTDQASYKQEIRKKVGMPLMWLGIGSIVMVFASLTSAVIVSKSSREWVDFVIPSTFMISTLIILISSGTYWWAIRAAKKEQYNTLKQFTAVTFILGLLFTYFQFSAWGEMTENGVYFAGAASTVSGSYMYVLTGLHLGHLFGGLVSLLFVYMKAARNKYNSNNFIGLQMSSTYWHFLSGLWVYLYLFLIFIS